MTSQSNAPIVFDDIRKPNIIIFGTDGLDASHMSLYGYERKTTPVIDELAKTSLVSQNHFTNACCTIGSTISTLTGKLPLETHTLVMPDILQGDDSYQHFIKILNSEGYDTVQWGNTMQINGKKWNMRSGFKSINGSLEQQDWLYFLKANFGDNANYFIEEIKGRLIERVLHILYIKDMEKPLSSADFSDELAPISDIQKVRAIINFMKNNKTPFFIHVHLMNTHGGRFTLERRFFSVGQSQSEGWNPDFMDDSILQYDQYVGKILSALEKNGQMDNTIFIIYTDHGSQWKTDKRIPLVIHFPKGEYAGNQTANTQNLDIVPTLLDYMHLSQPEWMSGNSLLQPISRDRLIFSFDASPKDERRNPPFFQFVEVRVTECQKWYALNLKTGKLQTGEVNKYTVPCPVEELRPLEKIQDAMLDLLINNGYNTSGLPLQKIGK
jgi:arylsulfatase A-like enzyme